MDLGGREVGTEAVVIDDESFGKGHWASWGLIWERLSIEGVKHRAVETCLRVDKRVKSKMTQGFLVWVTQIMAGLLTGREGTDLRTNIFTSVVDRFRHAQYTFRGLWLSKQLEVFPVRLVFVWKLAGELVFEYFLCSQLYLWSVLQSEVLKNVKSRHWLADKSYQLNHNQEKSILWKIPWTEEPGGLQSMELQRIRHNWTHSTHTQATLLGMTEWATHSLSLSRCAAKRGRQSFSYCTL